MKNITKKLIVILTLLQILTISSISAKTKETRIALIIGNSHYSNNIGTLANPANDATDMATTLKKLGFEVISGIDLKREEMFAKLDEFENKLRASNPETTVGLFYYAGHGMEVDGENYLLPSDAKVKYQQDMSRAGVKLNQIIKTMKYSNNRLNIVVLDACRNNPLPKKPNSRSVSSGGWKEITELAEGMFIGYGTSKGREAADGNGRNGLFTKHLIQNIQQPGLTIERVFKNTRIAVNKESIKLGKPQLPTDDNQLLGDFYFIPPKDNNTITNTQPVNSNNNQTVSSSIKPNNNFFASIIPQSQIDVVKRDPEGTVVDKQRNLMWMRCSLGQTWNKNKKSCGGEAEGFNKWKNAMKKAKKSKFAGYNNWRVPKIEEFETLIYCSTGEPKIGYKGRLDGCPKGYNEPTIDIDKFPNTSTSIFGYWSASSLFPDDTRQKYTIHFDKGQTSNGYYTGYYRKVRLVRTVSE